MTLWLSSTPRIYTTCTLRQINAHHFNISAQCDFDVPYVLLVCGGGTQAQARCFVAAMVFSVQSVIHFLCAILCGSSWRAYSVQSVCVCLFVWLIIFLIKMEVDALRIMNKTITCLNVLALSRISGSLFKYDSAVSFWNFLAVGNYASEWFYYCSCDDYCWH